MAPPPHRSARRRARRGSLERPVSARLYRGTWLLVGLPMLVAAFSVSRPVPLPAPALPPTFDGGAASALASELARSYPDRRAGSSGAAGAAAWFSEQLAPYGFRTTSDVFSAEIPGRGRVRLQNVIAVAAGPSRHAIVVMAHRDNLGLGPGANDNASGTAALVELARSYANPQSTANVPRAAPANTIIFLSTDGGADGGLGAEHFATSSRYRDEVIAVLNLDSLAGRGGARVQSAADEPRSPSPALVSTVAARVLEQTGDAVLRPSALRQLIDFGFPFTLYEQGPFLARGIPALTLTTAGDRPPAAVEDDAVRLDRQRLGRAGLAAQALLGSLDSSLELARGTSSYIYLGERIVPGWAVQLVLIAMLLPFLAAVVDLFARCRRRRLPLAPAFRSYRSRLGFWLFSGGVFAVLGVLGAWPEGASRPPAPESLVAGDWRVVPVLGGAAIMTLGWFVARERLIPRREIGEEEQLAGYAAALLALALVALLVVATNPYALIFALPSLHAWIWLPNLRTRPAWVRAVVALVGLAGPALLLWSFAVRLGLGFDAPWYLLELVAVGYVSAPPVIVLLAWLAVAAQLAALSAGRYAPYPAAQERPPRGPVRAAAGRLLALVLTHRRVPEEARRALGG